MTEYSFRCYDCKKAFNEKSIVKRYIWVENKINPSHRVKVRAYFCKKCYALRKR